MSGWEAVRLDDVEAIALPYAPLTWRPVRQAIGARPHIRSDPDRAAAIVAGLRARRPDSPGLPIADALLAVGRGDDDAARAALARVDPRYRDALRSDPDLGPLDDEDPET